MGVEMSQVVRSFFLMCAICAASASHLPAVVLLGEPPAWRLSFTTAEGFADAPQAARPMSRWASLPPSTDSEAPLLAGRGENGLPPVSNPPAWDHPLAQNSTPAVDGEPDKEPAQEADGNPKKGDNDASEDEFEKEFGKSMESKISDPFSGYNRAMTVFNDKLYLWVLLPVSTGYRAVVPELVRRGFLNFFKNLLFPVRFINNILQLKFINAGVELTRFTLNSTIGVAGLWDPAKVWFGLEPREEDFGQTLAYWGVGAGPHIVLPFWGPSNLRDAIGKVPDFSLDPVTYVDPATRELSVRVFDEINDTSLHIGEYENLKKDALDLYPFLRDVYEQNRNKEIAE